MKLKRMLLCAALVIAASAPAKAQVVFDLSLVTCKDYMGYDSERQDMITYWMSGYFNAAKGYTTIDFKRLNRNIKVVGDYCKKHKDETLMSAIQRNAR
jgi:acid stress chaperone HdeB